jgi:nitrogen fixation/metabolism regulation signal transduction histidine kinase
MSKAQQTGGKPPRSQERKVQNYLINRSFQLRWVGAVIVLTTLLLSVLGGYILYSEQQTSDAIITGLNSYYEADAAATMAEMFQAEDSAVLWVLLGTGLVLVLLLAGVGIIVTHKVAGPMVGLKQSLDAVAQGKYNRIRGFRQGDAFPLVSQSLVGMGTALRTRETADIARLSSLLEREDLPDDVSDFIREIVEEKRGRGV